MKFRFINLIFFIILFSCSNNDKKIKDLMSYQIKPLLNAKEPRIEVVFKAIADKKGKLILNYDNEKWGESNLFHSIKIINSSDFDDVQILPDSSKIIISSKPNKELNIKYKIIQDQKGEIEDKHTYRPIIQKEYFHLFGHRLFIFPTYFLDSKKSKKTIQLEWINNNPDFTIHNSFGKTLVQTISSPLEEIESSIFVGGDFLTLESNINNNSLFFVTRNEWKNIDIEKVNIDLTQIIKLQRDFWKDHSDSFYTVTMIPTFGVWNDEYRMLSYGGTGLTNSFACFATDNPGLTNNDLNYLFSHELFHNWIGSQIKNENEEEQYWFSEGFTEYYSYKLLLKGEFLNTVGFINKINNDILKPYYNSTVINMPNSEITNENFWSNIEYEKLPYYRGFLYAFYLDIKIKNIHNQNKSLDDLLKVFLSKCRDGNLKFNHQLFISELEKFGIENYDIDFKKYILNGEPINIDQYKIEGLTFSLNEKHTPHITINNKVNNTELSKSLQR